MHPYFNVAVKTVATFASIVKRPLKLEESANAYAGYNTIGVPLTLDGLDYYTTVEHEIAHILFKSDPTAQTRFVSKTAVNIQRSALQKANVQVGLDGIKELLNAIISSLDDYRVQELWGRIYEGSLYNLTDLRKRQLFDVVPLAQDNLAIYIACLAVGVDPEEPIEGVTVRNNRFAKYKPHILEAMQKVRGRDFRATLLVSRWLLVKLTEELIRQGEAGGKPGSQNQSVGKKRMEALNQLTQQAGTMPDKAAKIIDDLYDEKNKPTEERVESAKMAEEAAGSELTEAAMEELLKKSEKEMGKILEDAQKALTSRESVDSKVERAVDDTIEFIEGRPDQNFNDIDVDDLYDEDVAARRLKATFSRLLGRYRTRLAYEGAAVDVSAYIARRLQNSDDPFFVEEHKSLGYSAIVLLDRSGSMKVGGKEDAVDSASRILRRAMDFPFVNLEMWGFAGNENGVTGLFRHDPHDFVFAQKMDASVPKTEAEKKFKEKNSPWAWTPLHLAIQAAAETLRNRPGEKYLFVLTDGMPSMKPKYNLKSGPMLPAELTDVVRASVQKARRDGVHVTALILGEELKGADGIRKIVFGMPAASMKRMFGLQRYWKAVGPNEARNALTSLVTGSLAQHIRRG